VPGWVRVFGWLGTAVMAGAVGLLAWSSFV
jgi:hypothetical protein